MNNEKKRREDWVKEWRKAPMWGWGISKSSPLCIDCYGDENNLKKVYLLDRNPRPHKYVILFSEMEAFFKWRRANPGAEKECQIAYIEELEQNDYNGPFLENDYREWKAKNNLKNS